MIRRIVPLLFLLPVFCLAYSDNIKFEHLTIKQGLSQNSVYSIIQGPQGFLWFATEDGLNRFDGIDFKIYRHNPDNPHSISSNLVFALHQDHLGNLWIGTSDGLNRFDYRTEQFERFQYHNQQPNSLSHNWVWSVKSDNKNRLWVGTRKGANLFRQDSKDFVRYSKDTVYDIHQDQQQRIWLASNKGIHLVDESKQTTNLFQISKNDPNDHRANFIRSIAPANKQQLWLGTSRGLALFNTNNKQITRIKPRINTSNQVFNHYISKIHKDHNSNTLWLGTLRNGLYRFEPSTRELTAFNYDYTNPYSLSTNKITTINQDNQGAIWIGTDSGGLNKINFDKLKFGHVMQIRSNPDGLKHSGIYAIYKDKQQRIWAGSQKGLSILNPSETIPSLKAALDQQSILNSANIAAIEADQNNDIWIATRNGDLFKFNQQQQQFSQQSFKPNNDQNNPSVYRLYAHKNQLWIGTNYGLYVKSLTDSNFNQKADIQSLNQFAIRDITAGNHNQLWLATDHGLASYQPSTGTIRHYSYQSHKADGISGSILNTLYLDQQGILWIGTHGSGLNRFDPKTKVFIHYNEKHGLSNNAIYAILPDQQGNLWLSTNKGLSKFNPKQQSFRNYDDNDGLQSNEFNYGASYKAHDGELLFAGVNGFNRFYPQNIKDDSQKPQVALTQFLVSNKPISTAATSINQTETSFSIPESINSLNTLTLTYLQNLITFEFAALHFSNTQKNQYAYRLIGQDKNWLTTNYNNRRATYTNLPAGRYQLQIKASNADGYWNEQGKTLNIIVTPPPWKTWWAYSLYFLVALSIIGTIAYSQHRKIKYQRTINTRLKQIDKLKDEFLANTSHELRTPLNGIIGITESVLDGATGPLSKATKDNLSMVVSSGKRLSNLINDILDFSKIKNRSLMLFPKAIDLYSMIDVVVTLSKPLITNPEIKLINDVSKDLPTVSADENRLQQILYNLVGNAIKFTDKGEIKVSAFEEQGEIIVKVIDTGVGIDPTHINKLFNTFEQPEEAKKRQQNSTGLGLSVSKKLVQLHGGNLKVKSTLGRGTTFSFNLPISGEQSTGNPDNFQNLNRLHQLKNQEHSLIEPNKNDEQSPTGARILIVDDEPINRQVLHNHLSLHNYRITEACGGEQALELIEQQGPFDLILLDIMMPQISGYQVCSKLRERYAMNDLPIIFLSAKNQVSDLMAGFSVGANDYLTKPVTKEELLTRVEAHLTFLDIHRNLEQRVAARTEQLQHKNQQIIDTQQQLVQAEKMASLGTLTAGVAHEINNPINFVFLSQQNLIADLKKAQQYFIDLIPEEQQTKVTEQFENQFKPLYQHLNTISEGTERIKHIVQDLRTFTQHNCAEQKEVVITELLQATINLVQAQYSKYVDFEVIFSVQPSLNCYPANLNQVFMNLLVNACHAIQMKLQREKQLGLKKGRITCKCKQTDNNIEIFIIDNGCGMSDTTKNKLFEPFYTTKEVGQGTGLGLSVSFGIIQQHNGSITVESEQGQGSTFVITLPKEQKIIETQLTKQQTLLEQS